MDFFQGCTALITGASSGLGEEFARQLAPHVGILLLVARRSDRLKVLAEELCAEFPNLSIFSFPTDLADEKQRLELAQQIQHKNLQVDLLINNAGLGDWGHFDSSEWERTKAILEINMVALTHLTHLFLPMLKNSARGAILNVSSILAFFPWPNAAVYSATKAYVSSFSETLRIELQRSHVTVTSVCPGPVVTEFRKVAAREGFILQEPNPESWMVQTPSAIVSAALHAVIQNQPRVIPGFWLSIAVILAMIMPLWIIRRFIGKKHESTS